MRAATRLFALTTHGLESVSAHEIASLGHTPVQDAAYRRITFDWNGDLKTLLGLRTVDDLFLDLDTWTDIGHRRDELERLSHLAGCLEMSHALANCRRIRPISDHPSFAVSASFVGRRNYTVAEIKAAIAHGVQRSTGWLYQERDDFADLSIRIFIEHSRAYAGVRLGRAPLHERPYRTEHRGGALKPSVAAAMVRLAAPHSGIRVIDPCCGTGTIAIEASLAGLASTGFDRDRLALSTASRHASAAGVSIGWGQANAEHLPVADASADCIISNLPWGRQASVERGIGYFYARCLDELLRVVTPGGRLVLLVEDPGLLPVRRFRDHHCLQISLYGRRPTIIVATP